MVVLTRGMSRLLEDRAPMQAIAVAATAAQALDGILNAVPTGEGLHLTPCEIGTDIPLRPGDSVLALDSINVVAPVDQRFATTKASGVASVDVLTEVKRVRFPRAWTTCSAKLEPSSGFGPDIASA